MIPVRIPSVNRRSFVPVRRRPPWLPRENSKTMRLLGLASHSLSGLPFGPYARLFYFYIFRKPFLQKYIFNITIYSFVPLPPQGGGRGPAAQQRGGRDLYVNLKKNYLRGSLWREPAAPLPGGRPPAATPLGGRAPCRPAGGRQAPCCGQIAVAIRCVAIICVLDMDTNKNH